LIYRSQATRTEKRHLVTAPPRIAWLNSDSHCVSMLVVAGRLMIAQNLEFALRRSLILAPKHGVDRAKDQRL
jgi:hypothetical protein